MKMNKLQSLLVAIVLALGLSVGSSASAAMNFYVAMKANSNDIVAEPTTITMGGDEVAGMIEGYAFDHQITADGRGLVTHGEIRIIKRIDKSTPLLHKAMNEGEKIDAEFWFYQPNRASGDTERFLTLTLTEGIIISIAPWQTTGIGGGNPDDPFLEAITLSYRGLLIKSEIGRTEYQYIVEEPR
jgi:type VI secretion system secreted protein Hcp